jgi:hypothetical protein
VTVFVRIFPVDFSYVRTESDTVISIVKKQLGSSNGTAEDRCLHVTRSQFTPRHEEDLHGMRPLTRLASLVPEEEYIHRAPYGAAEAFGLHDLYHA